MNYVLVFGGAGYIGSHTVLRLLNKGYTVVVVDNLSTGHAESIKQISNLISDEERKRFNFEFGIDIMNMDQLEYIFVKYSQVTAVMHFCALIEVGESVKDPLKYYRNNVQGTINLLQVMIKHSITNFIFSSTAAIFGIPNSIPIEPDFETKPINPYGATKLCVENILKDCEKAYGIKYICLRYFNAAGAHESGSIGECHQPETHLIPLIFDVASGKRDKLFIFGSDYNTHDGTCIRDYVHVNDLAEAHILSLEYLTREKQSNCFNLGTNHGHSVLEIISTCQKITGKFIPSEIVARRPGDPDTLVASYKKAKEILGWTPKYTLEDIIRTAWKWHSQHPEGFQTNDENKF